MVTYCDICNTKLFRGKVCKECEDSLFNLTLDEMDKNPRDENRLAHIDGKLQKRPRIDEIDLDMFNLIEQVDSE